MEEQLIKKLGLQNHKNLLEKTTELLRLLKLKSTSTLSGVNEYARITICIDLAATLLGITIDLVDLIKQSSLKKTLYEKYKRTFQKLLDLNKPPGINEICINLNCNEVVRKAQDLLNLYNEKVCKTNENDIDLSHPQYAAMAVFQACKLTKTKIVKAKILGFSYLRPSQWSRLEQQWDKLIKEYGDEIKNSKQKSKNLSDDTKKLTNQIEENTKDQIKRIEIEDYQTWKARIIKKAQQEIEQQEILEKDIQLMDLDDSF